MDGSISPLQQSGQTPLTLPALTPDEMLRQILRCISQCRVGCRPGRFEPRYVKRRRDQYKLMMEPRDKLRQRLSKGDNSFE